MELCGNNDMEFSTTLLSLCEEIETVSRSTLSAQTAALSIEGMVDGLWQNFLLGPPGFNRQQAMATVFELIGVIYAEQRLSIRQYSVSSN